MQYDSDKINEVCEQINLLEYASQTMEFIQSGSNWFTKCPKHDDKTPSLCIYPEQNTYHCFSCGRHGNLLTWIMDYEDKSFIDALQKVSALSHVNINNMQQADIVKALKQIKKLKQIKLNNKEVNHPIIDYAEYDKYSKDVPVLWEEEGIDPLIMRKYDIRIDRSSNRIVYPVYDNDDNLIGIKGRTMFDNYKDLGIQKYINYYKLGTTDFFVGMKQNRQNIIEQGEAIILEGIKSGMKIEAWGYNNWIASETSHLNDSQIRILISLHVKRVVIAYDADVKYKDIVKNTKLLRRFMDVYVIRDKDKLLGEPGEKRSPCDMGKEVWECLYRKKELLH